MSDDLQSLGVSEGIERFLNYREPSVRESTFYNARTRLRFFEEWADERGIEDLNELSGRDLADFVAWRQDDLAAVTMQKQLSTIRQALRWWADIEAVPEGLAEKVHAPDVADGDEARDIHLEQERARAIIEYLDRYQYASREHVIMALLWRTGMRRGALRSLDLRDLRPDDEAVVLKHRPGGEANTKLKNGEAGERWVYLGPQTFGVVEEYVEKHRHDVTDKEGREPLITSMYGRPTGDTIYRWVNTLTHPCVYGEGCPHDRDPETCEATSEYPARCPSARSPHAIRRGHITAYLNEDTPPETVSERCDVALETLYQHYDARTPREKMDVRREQLPGEGA